MLFALCKILKGKSRDGFDFQPFFNRRGEKIPTKNLNQLDQSSCKNKKINSKSINFKSSNESTCIECSTAQITKNG